jgi:hypothetical protein
MSRLLVALEPDEDSLWLIEGYARLAAELHRDLVALLLDDAGLDHAMALPFARLQPLQAVGYAEVGPSTARHALRVFRRRIEGRIGEVCQRLEVRWQLTVSAALPEPIAGDILVFGPRARRAVGISAQACPVVLMRRTGRALAVLYEGTPETLTLAAAVARRERLPVTVLVKGDGAASTAHFAAEAAAAFGADSVTKLAGTDADLLAKLSGLRPRAVVVDACNASIRLDVIVTALGR